MNYAGNYLISKINVILFYLIGTKFTGLKKNTLNGFECGKICGYIIEILNFHINLLINVKTLNYKKKDSIDNNNV